MLMKDTLRRSTREVQTNIIQFSSATEANYGHKIEACALLFTIFKFMCYLDYAPAYEISPFQFDIFPSKTHNQMSCQESPLLCFSQFEVNHHSTFLYLFNG